MILPAIQSVPEVIIDSREITDPDTAARIKRIARELEIEKQFGIVGAELAKSRAKRKYLYKT